jgi:hypothetical protein
LYFNIPPLKVSHPYFNAVVGLARSNDPESNAGGSIATGRAYTAREIKVMTQSK